MSKHYTMNIDQGTRVLKDDEWDSMRMLRIEELDAVTGGCFPIHVEGPDGPQDLSPTLDRDKLAKLPPWATSTYPL